MIRNAHHTINLINSSIKHKKKQILCNNVNTLILKKFYKLNLIEHFEIKNSFTKINFNPEFKNFKIINYSRVNGKIFLTVNQIRVQRLNLYSTIYLISTNKGILTQYEALQNKCGGFLIAKIIFN